MALVSIFSTLPYPITQTVIYKGKKESLKVLPGPNFVDGSKWDLAVKSSPQAWKSRMELGRIRANYKPAKHEIEALRDPASRSFIRELSAKAAAIADGELFDGRGSGSNNASINDAQKVFALEAEIARLKTSMNL